MIRNTRALVAVNAIGALAALFLLVLWALSPPEHSALPKPLLIGIEAFLFGYFVYNIVMRLSGRPVPGGRWTLGMSDRRLWLVKGILLAVLAIVAIAIIFVRLG